MCLTKGQEPQKLDLSWKNNKPCHVSGSATQWECGEIEMLEGQSPFPEASSQVNGLFTCTPCSYSSHSQCALISGFVLLFSSKAETLGLRVKSISCQGCKNQKLLWGSFTENCFSSQSRLRHEIAGPL